MRGRLKLKTFDDIIASIEAGESTVKAAELAGVSPQKLYRMLDAEPELADRYARARAHGMDRLAEQTLGIADEPCVDQVQAATNRLRVDTRKWLLAKLYPKKYGDRTILAGDPDAPLEHRHVAGQVEGKLFQGTAARDSAQELGDADNGGTSEPVLPVELLGKT